MSWFAVMNGTHKLVQYGNGQLVSPQLFNLDLDPAEMQNLYNTSDGARAAVATLDAQLRSIIPYEEVSQEVAQYQLAQFQFWAAHTPDWRAEIASANVRWQRAFAAHSAAALAAAEAYLSQQTALIRSCDGRLASV
jgi:arylsulfatase K